MQLLCGSPHAYDTETRPNVVLFLRQGPERARMGSASCAPWRLPTRPARAADRARPDSGRYIGLDRPPPIRQRRIDRHAPGWTNPGSSVCCWRTCLGPFAPADRGAGCFAQPASRAIGRRKERRGLCPIGVKIAPLGQGRSCCRQHDIGQHSFVGHPPRRSPRPSDQVHTFTDYAATNANNRSP
jgi:hypothetical protein